SPIMRIRSYSRRRFITRKSPASPSNRTLLTELILPLFCRRCHRPRLRTARPRVGLLFLQPQAVVLLRPVEVDRALTHRLVRALHAERAEIDVREDQRDEQHAD